MIRILLTCGLIFSFSTSALAQGEPQEVRIIEDSLSADDRYQFDRHFFEAQRLKAVDKPDEALASFMMCLDIDPDHPVVNYEIGQYFLDHQQPTEAERYLEKARSADPNNKWVIRALWKLSEESFNPTVSKQLLLKLHDLEPSNGEYLWELSVIYIELNNQDSAIHYLDKLESMFGYDDAFMRQRMNLYMRSGDFQKAENELLKTVRMFPQRMDLKVELAEFYNQQGRVEDASRVYARILELDPTNAQAHVQVGGALVRANELDSAKYHIRIAMRSPNMEVGYKLNLLGYFEDPAFEDFAQEMLDTIIKVHPNDARAFLSVAEKMIADGKYAEGREMLKRVLDLPDGDKWDVWEKLLFIDAGHPDPQLLLEDAEAAIDRYPLQPRAYLFLGEAHLRLQNPASAVETFEEGLLYANTPEMTTQFKMELARAYHQDKDYSTSDMYFEEILDDHPDFHLALNNYAFYLTLRKVRLDDAEKYIEKAVELSPHNPNYWDTYAWLMFVKKEDEKALEFINRAVQTGGDSSPDIQEHRGDILAAMGRKNEAVNAYQRAISLGGNPYRIQQKINDLP